MNKLTFTILCLEGAILSFNVSATSALVPSIAKYFGLSNFVVGKIIWLYMIPYGISALFYGPLVRVFSFKWVELICFFCFTLANLIAGFSRNIFTLYIARFFMGFFGASVIPLVLILISNNVNFQNRGRLVGIFFSITFISSLFGLFLSGLIFWRYIFLIPAILGFLLLIIMVFYFPNLSYQKEKFQIRYLDALKDKKIFSIFLYIFLISMLYHGLQQWFAVYFSGEFRLTQKIISFLLSLSHFGAIFGETIGGWFSDIFGRIKTINLGVILMIISVFFLMFRIPLLILAFILIIWGFGWTFNHAGLSSLITDLPKKFLNEIASLNSSIRFISGGIGVIFAKFIMERSFIIGFLIFEVLFLSLLLFNKKLIRKEI